MIPRRVLTVVAAGAFLAPWAGGGAALDPAPVAAGPAAATTPAGDAGSVAGKITFSGKEPDRRRCNCPPTPGAPPCTSTRSSVIRSR